MYPIEYKRIKKLKEDRFYDIFYPWKIVVILKNSLLDLYNKRREVVFQQLEQEQMQMNDSLLIQEQMQEIIRCSRVRRKKELLKTKGRYKVSDDYVAERTKNEIENMLKKMLEKHN